MMKFAAKTFSALAPRAAHLLRKLDFTPADTFNFFTRMGQQPPGLQTDHKQIAFDWLKANPTRWADWVLPPPVRRQHRESHAYVHLRAN